MKKNLPSSTKREQKYDCLRVLSVLAIIAVHAVPIEIRNTRQWWFSSFFTPLLLAFVGIYFMMSGLFILDKGTENIPSFYKKRFISIGIPFLVYGLIYYCFNVYVDHTRLSIPGHIEEYLKEIVTAGIPRAGHMWYMYAIAAFYICAPFLSRMFRNMTDREIKWFLIIMAAIQGLDMAGEAVGVNLRPSFQYVLYTGWIYYFALGYGLKRICARRQVPYFVILGLLSLVFDVVVKLLLPGWEQQNPHRSPAMIFICGAIFLTFEFYGGLVPATAAKCAEFFSRYSYSIYLIHFMVLKYLVEPILLRDLISRHYFIGIAASVAVTFILSFICSLAVDHIAVKPLQRLAGQGGRFRGR